MNTERDASAAGARSAETGTGSGPQDRQSGGEAATPSLSRPEAPGVGVEHLRKLLKAVEAFAAESNRIEGIKRTTPAHVDAHIDFLGGAVHIPALVEFVAKVQPDARLRNSLDVPGVRVGNHIAPPSGPDIETDLRAILAIRDPWEQHVAYETLHPFTDGNGRSGRALWLHRYFHESELDPWAVQRGFLHSFYYHTLSGVRLPTGTAKDESIARAALSPSDGKGVDRER